MRILVANGPYAGHTLPMERLVRALVAHGHAVTWYVDTSATERVVATGATHLPLPDGIATILAGCVGWKTLGPKPEDLQGIVTRFVMATPVVRQDLVGREADFDVVVSDPIMLGVHRFASAASAPLVTVGMIPALYTEPAVALHLQCCVPGFEYPRPDIPQMVCIGPLLPMAEPDWQPPEWWETLPQKPLVIVAQGTVATAVDDLAQPALEALQQLPQLEGIILNPQWEAACHQNVHVLPRAPYPQLLARAALFITNGGYGGVTTAITLGKPVIVTGVSEDKPEVGHRVAWSGVGLHLSSLTGHPTMEQIRDAIVEVSVTPRFVERAQEFAARAAQTNAPETACMLIEALVASRQKEAAA